MKLTIGFVTQGLPFHGNSLKEGSLGGSETACLCLANELSQRGHDVSVYCECHAPAIYDGVEYYHHSQFLAHVLLKRYDVLIASRWMEYLALPASAGLRMLWLHDTITDENRFMANLWQTDLVAFLSDFHIKNYAHKVLDVEKFAWKTSNGVDLEACKIASKFKVPNKVIFTSRPERGLVYLLRDILPKLIEKIPNIQLYYCNYTLGNMQVPEHIIAQNQLCEMLAHQYKNNVIKLGNLTKEKLYNHLSSSQLLLYPSAFPEISCISAMEAAACGTPIITTNDFALKETVDPRCGVLIDGSPSDPEYIEKFVETTVQLLSNTQHLKEMSQAGPQVIAERGYTWKAVAENWEAKFLSTMRQRFHSEKEKIVAELFHQSDLVTAYNAAERLQLDTAVVDGKIAEVQALEYAPSSSSEVIETITKAKPRFERVIELLKRASFTPTRVLDFACGDSAFGLFVKKAAPSAEVVVLDKSQEVLDRVQLYAKRAGLELDTICGESIPEGTQLFDLIFIGNYVETLRDPHQFLKSLAPYLSEGGYVVFTCEYGPLPLKNQEFTRVWNFRVADFAEMFPTDNKHYVTSCCEEVTATGDLKGYWIVATTNVANTQKFDMEKRLITTRPYRSLAVCMIAGNEEDNISGCIKSIRDIADRVVVACSGTDKTAEIAESLGAEVRHIKFDNFSQARNESKKDVSEDWILWIDADERLINPKNLRRYLGSVIFEGFTIRQQHLMIDIHGTYDLPIRVFRNRPYYKFTGLIHEHCENISNQPFDDPIYPAFVLPNVDIAHYGYPNEAVRKQKCSNRNMELLRRDVEESKGRMLTQVLVIRDYLNMVKWHIEKTGGFVEEGSEQHQLVSAAVETYLQQFSTSSSRYKPLAFPMYQEALMILGRSGLCHTGRKLPPFEVAFALHASLGGLDQDVLTPKKTWFVDGDEFITYMRGKTSDVILALGLSSDSNHREDLTPPEPKLFGEEPDAPRLLKKGINLFPKK